MTNDTADSTDYDDVLYAAFERRYREGQDSWSNEDAMRELVPLLLPRLSPRSRVLDIGAGRGPDTITLLSAGHQVTATDLVRLPDWDAIQQRWGHQVAFRQGDFTRLPRLGVFDAAVDNGVLHHQSLDRYDAYLAAVHQHLRPGGTFALSLFAPALESAEGRLNRADDGRLSRWFTEDEAQNMLGESGFETVTVQRVVRQLAGMSYLLVIATTAA